MKIAILGAGAYGTALGQVLLENGYETQYYDPLLLNTSLDTTLDGASYILLAVPSSALPDLLPLLPKELPLIVTTKGILDNDTLAGFNDVLVLSGPGFADDIKAHKTTTLTASDDRIIKLFKTDYLSFDKTEDAKGILMCGALKNVYAVLAGFLNLRPGTPEHEKFFADSLDEIREILSLNGADSNTADLVCGRGDLRLTCGLPSRNYEFGQNIRVNPKCCPDKTVEGMTVLEKIRAGQIVVPESARLLNDLLAWSKEWC